MDWRADEGCEVEGSEVEVGALELVQAESKSGRDPTSAKPPRRPILPLEAEEEDNLSDLSSFLYCQTIEVAPILAINHRLLSDWLIARHSFEFPFELS